DYYCCSYRSGNNWVF
nr:immunoglobulin light chain junction region [Macaca mulatta]MOW67318.1 immunoglobulin light chain junction region [Macaca mulatta]